MENNPTVARQNNTNVAKLFGSRHKCSKNCNPKRYKSSKTTQTKQKLLRIWHKCSSNFHPKRHKSIQVFHQFIKIFKILEAIMFNTANAIFLINVYCKIRDRTSTETWKVWSSRILWCMLKLLKMTSRAHTWSMNMRLWGVICCWRGAEDCCMGATCFWRGAGDCCTGAFPPRCKPDTDLCCTLVGCSYSCRVFDRWPVTSLIIHSGTLALTLHVLLILRSVIPASTHIVARYTCSLYLPTGTHWYQGSPAFPGVFFAGWAWKASLAKAQGWSLLKYKFRRCTRHQGRNCGRANTGATFS